jgi:mannobiose 2-epimerase
MARENRVDSIVILMSTVERLTALSAAAERELREDILPFWAEQTVDLEQGGFYGWITNDLKIDRDAPKGCVLNARILWTFSAAFRTWPEPLYRETADRAYAYLLEHFWDEEHSGLVWTVDHKGDFLEARKQTYGQAFGVYAFSEYFRATGSEESLEHAISLFKSIEAHAFEPPQGGEHGGYVEALARDWSPLEDMRLSPIDLNVPYSQNTHLHLLEAYAALLRVWPDPALRKRLEALWQILAFRIRDEKTNHLILFQDRNWKPLSAALSYGHDIEASWLLLEAAEVLGDKELIERTKAIALAMAEMVLEDGFDHERGGVLDGVDHDMSVLGKEWWPQAEAVVGFLNAYELSGKDDFLEAALASWQFIDQFVIDHTYGEWYYRVSPEGQPELELPKVSPWKCPYHNARAALETIERVQRLRKR